MNVPHYRLGRVFYLDDVRIPSGRVQVLVPHPRSSRVYSEKSHRYWALKGLAESARLRTPWISYSQRQEDYEFVDGEEWPTVTIPPAESRPYPVTYIKPKWDALVFTSWDGEPLEEL